MIKENKIRAIKVAQHLGISSSKLREFIAQVNFGVKPEEREFPENIANGIVRFVARKLGKKIEPLISLEEDNQEEEDKEVNKESTLEKLSKITQQTTQKQDSTKQQTPENKNKPPAIFRKIEINSEEKEKAKKKTEKTPSKVKTKEEREKEKLEEKAFNKIKKEKVVFKKKEGIVEIPEAISVKEFSEKIGVPVAEIITSLLKNGVIATINKNIDFDTCAIIADELEVKVKKIESIAKTEDLILKNLEKLLSDEKENLKDRPPVVVVMGHVDHGKTKILDCIRQTKVTEGEAGGITQHIGATQIEKNKQKITFLDTPGHEAFTAMRARGSKTADIAILVVAADEGIKDQTIEAIDHAKEADIPIIVAINKIDRENANIEKIKGELAQHELTPEDWGGKTICVPTSAISGQGISELLEMILLTAEMMELKANPNRLAVGTVLESHLDESLGPIATILINTGKLKIGDYFLVGQYEGRIKTMISDEGKKIKQALPSFPVQISGLSGNPTAGEILQVFNSKKILKEKSEELKNLKIEKKETMGVGMGIAEIMQNLQKGKIKILKVVLKADTDGSLEAVRQAVEKIKHEEVKVKIIHAGIGSITESDILMAAASGGVVFGFHAKASTQVKNIAAKENVEVQSFKIIFELTDIVKKILEGLLEPEFEEIITGEAICKKIFWSKGKVKILGCKINKGFLENQQELKIYRQDKKIGTGKVAILQHFEKKVNKVEHPQECGIQFEGNLDVQEEDIILGIKMEKKIKTL